MMGRNDFLPRLSLSIAFLIVLSLCIVALPDAASASTALKWEQVARGGDFVGSVEIDPNDTRVMYAALTSGNYDDAGLWKTTDGGSHWTHPLTPAMTSCSVDPRNSLNVCAAGEEGIYTTTNGGTSWSLKVSGVFGQVARAPSNPSVIYVTGRYGAVCTSTNNGTSWGSVTIDYGYCTPFDLVIDPNNANIVYMLSGYYGYVYKSTNGGAGWTLKEEGLPVNPPVAGIDIDTTNSGHLMLAVSGVGVFETVNGAESWELLGGTGMPSSPGLDDILIKRGDPTVVCAAAGDHCYITRNSGASWQDYRSGLDYGALLKFTAHPTSTSVIYGAGNDGIYKGTWVSVPKITAISPTSGKVGAYVTIAGSSFGSSKGTSCVKFGTKLAYTSSTSWTNTKLKAKVPILSKGKTYITVITHGGTSNKYTFTVK